MAPTRSVAMGLNGAISAPHYLASIAGLRVLQDGGNALDACVAACAVLGVVDPQHCGIGGDLFIVMHPARGNGPIALNASGRAGARATPDFIRAAGHDRMPDKGPLSVVTPGCVHGWQTALERCGTRDLGTLLGPAIGIARNGFPATARTARALARSAGALDQTARDAFMPNGAGPRPGDVIRQPELAATLEQIATDGPRAMYDGPLGQAIGRFLESQGGHHTPEDIARHTSEWVEPAEVDFRGHRICTPPPNSQALLHLIALGVLDPVELGDPQSARATHLQLEAMKYAFRDRHLIADPACGPVPVEVLLSKEHAAEGRAQLSMERASAPAAPLSAGDTVYLCAGDRDGNLISMIHSHRQTFGSGVMVPGLGVLLNDRARDFGLDDGDVNQIAPHKRPRHTLSPSLVMRDGKPACAYGTRGGDGQPFTTLQLACNLMAFGMGPQEAIDAPRWSVEPLAAGPIRGQLEVEGRFAPEVREQLAAMGHPVLVAEDFEDGFGTAGIVQFDHERGVLLAGADARGDGVALAF